MIPTKDHFNEKNIKILSIDFETKYVAKQNRIRNQIFAAGFYSNNGINEAIHLEDCKFRGDEVKFIRYIVYKIQTFQGIITGTLLILTCLFWMGSANVLVSSHRLDSTNCLFSHQTMMLMLMSIVRATMSHR